MDEVAGTVRDQVFQPMADALAAAGWNCFGAARWCVLAGVPMALVPAGASLAGEGPAGAVAALACAAFLVPPVRFLRTLLAEAAALERARPGPGVSRCHSARSNMTVALLVATLSWLAAAIVALDASRGGGGPAEMTVAACLAVGFLLFGTGSMLATCVWREPPPATRRTGAVAPFEA